MNRNFNFALAGLFVATIAWGASFFLVKQAVMQIGLWPFMVYRFSLAAIIFLLMFPSKIKAGKFAVRQGLILGIFLFLALWTQTMGLQYTTAGHSGFLTTLYVPLTPLAAYAVLKTKMYWSQWIVVTLAFAGSYLMMNPGQMWVFNKGDIWTLATATVCAFQIVVTGLYSRREPDSLALGLWQIIGCALFFGVLALFHRAQGPEIWDPRLWPQATWISILFNSAVTTCFCFTVQIICQKTIGELKAALIFGLEGPFAAFFGFLFLNERMDSWEILGAAMVFLASVIPEKWFHASTK